MIKKLLTIMVIPDHNSSKIRVIKLPAFFIPVFCLISFVCVGLFGFYAWGYYKKALERSEYEQLLMENTHYAQRFERMSSQVDSIKSEIEFLTQQDRMLRLLADLPNIDEETREVGMGGNALSIDELASDVMNVSGLPASVGVDVDQLLRETDLLKASFEEIESTFKDQRYLLDHTPTVMPTTGWFSSFFGRRRDPFTGRRQYHRGVDIASRKGTPIYATADGVVKNYVYDKNLGRLLIIDHDYGYETRYGHLQKSLVKKGQEVKRGQTIALMGSTGRSTSSHLHYEVILNGQHQNPLNYFYADEAVD